MATSAKIEKIASHYNLSAEDLLKDLYIKQKLSAIEIQEKFFVETGILITPRSVQRKIKSLKLTRSLSEAFLLAIRKGRKSYKHLTKSVKSSELRRGINLRLRYYILERDDFRCVLCGNTAKVTQLEIDHIVPVVKGGNNEPENLRVLCRACNAGKKLLKYEN